MDVSIFVYVLSLFSVVAIVLNGSTLIAILTSPTLRKTANIFTFNIALADFVSAVVLSLKAWLDMWADLDFDSNLLNYIMGSAMLTGILSTLSVAIHRFIIIRLDPFNSRQLITGHRCVAVCVIIWLVDVTVYLCCYFLDTEVFLLFIAPIILLVSLGVCAVVYGIVYVTISASLRCVALNKESHAQRVEKNKQVLCTFALVVGSNFVCWLVMCFTLICLWTRPNFTLAYYPRYGRYRTASWFNVLYIVGYWIVYINAIINPIVIWTRLSDFREMLHRRCCCWRRRRHDWGNEPTSMITQDGGVFDGGIGANPGASVLTDSQTKECNANV